MTKHISVIVLIKCIILDILYIQILCMVVIVKKIIKNLVRNDLFLLLMYSVIGYIAFSAIVITVLQIPSEAILNSGLKEILLVFEG